MSHDVTCPVATEEHALNCLHAALAAHPNGLTIGKLAEASGYGRGYLERLLTSPYFKREGYRWRHDPQAVDPALLAALAAQFRRAMVDRGE